MSLPVLVPLLLAVTGAQPYDTSVPNDPRVEVWLDSNAELDRGDRARVYARSAQDGFLLVLHADAEGRVRVLYPIDPYMDDFVRGGETIEIRGRSDREAIFVDERAGSGVVLAAWSPDPFRFDAYVRGDHWDYRLITPVGANEDGEAALLDVVHRMADGRSFDYDVEPYVVGARSARTPIHVAVGLGSPWCWGCGGWPYHHRSGFHLSVRIGDPYWGPHFSYWRPYWLRPVYYDPYWYRSRWAWGHGWWGYDRWDWRDRRRGGVHIRYAWSSPCWNDPYCGRDPWRRARPGRASGTWLAGDSEWLGRGAPPLLDPSRSDTRSRFGGTRVTSPERSPNVDRVIAEPERQGIRDGTRTIARPERPGSGGSDPRFSRGMRIVEPEPSRAEPRSRFEGGTRITRPEEPRARPSNGTLWSRGAGFIEPEPSRTRTIPGERATRPQAPTTRQPVRTTVPRPSRSLSDAVRNNGARADENPRPGEQRSARSRAPERSRTEDARPSGRASGTRAVPRAGSSRETARPSGRGITESRPRPSGGTQSRARPSSGGSQSKARPSSGGISGSRARPSGGASRARPAARTGTRRGG